MSGKKISPEIIILLIGVAAFALFGGIILFLLMSVAGIDAQRVTTDRGRPVVTATDSAFVLPSTWTPTPRREIQPTPTGTLAAAGLLPTRIYTPRPTSLSGLPMPVIAPRLSVLDLARIMQGESPGDREAAYMVGWVAKNRLVHVGYGETYAVVSHGFFGYRAHMHPSKEFMSLARNVIKSTEDPTGGCLYALSRTDITKLGIPPGRADVAFGEWFFFRTWPLPGR